MLNLFEKKFIWNLINLDEKKSIDALEKISEKSNIIQYAISNRIDYYLRYFIAKNNIETKFSVQQIKHLHDAVSFKNYRSLLFYEEISKISSLFIKNNVNHVFLKGAANISFNEEYILPMRDIDILVSIDDIPRATKILSNLGFYGSDKSKQIQNVLPNDPSIYCLPLLKNDNDIFLEIHYKIVSGDNSIPCKFSKLMLKDKCIKNMQGVIVNIPSDEDMLLHYLYHGATKGNFDVGPSAVLTINELRKTKTFNEEKLLKKSKLANLNFEYKIFHALKDFKNQSKEIKKCLIDIFLMPTINRKITSIQLEDGLVDKIKLILKTIFVEKKLIMQEFNLLNFYVYHYLLYLLRWFRQAKFLMAVTLDIFSKKRFVSNRSSIILKLKKEFN